MLSAPRDKGPKINTGAVLLTIEFPHFGFGLTSRNGAHPVPDPFGIKGKHLMIN